MKALVTITLAAATTSLLTACGTSDNGTFIEQPAGQIQSQIDTVYQGQWKAPGYGSALDINENSVALYRFTSDYCFIQDSFDDVTTEILERSLQQTEESDVIEWFSASSTGEFGTPGLLFEKQSALPASCEDEVLRPDSTVSNSELYAMFSQIMAEYYVDFSLNNVDWPAVTYQQSLTVSDDLISLYEAIYQSFLPLADGHNRWTTTEGTEIAVLGKPTHVMKLIEEFARLNSFSYPLQDTELNNEILNEIGDYIDQQLAREQAIIASYATSDIESGADDKVIWSTIGDIGYLRIDSMTGFTTEPDDADDLEHVASSLANINTLLSQAINDFTATRGLIIDIRYNGGGSDFISLAVASHFTDAPYIGYSKYARDGAGFTNATQVEVPVSEEPGYINRPIILLVSEETASAAESFAVMMSQLDTVTLIGESTQGIFSDRLQWLLPGENILSLSNEVYLTPDGEWLEGKGVPVDTEVAFFSLDDRQAGVDSGLETAIVALNK